MACVLDEVSAEDKCNAEGVTDANAEVEAGLLVDEDEDANVELGGEAGEIINDAMQCGSGSIV